MEQRASDAADGFVSLSGRSWPCEPPMSPASAMLSALLEDESEDENGWGNVFQLSSSESAAEDRSAVQRARDTTQCVIEENGTTLTASLKPSAASIVPPSASLKRRRLKDQLDTLREEFESLQQDLSYLQASRVFARKRAKVERGNGKKFKTNRHSSLPKKSILQENRDLRRLVNKQRKFTQEFGEKLYQSAKKVPSKFDLVSDSDPVPARLTNADLMCYYEALAGKLDSLYTQLSHVLATSRATIDKRRREATHTLIVRNCDTNAMTLQFHHHKILPFDFQSSCDAIWKCLRDEAVSGSERGDEVVLPREDNLILMKKTILVESPDGRGHPEIKLPVRVITKRFVSKDRMVLCWEGTTTWPRSVVQAPDDLQICENSWLVVRPMPSSGSTRMCFTQLCSHMSPSGAVVAFPEQGTKLISTVIPRYQQVIDGYHQSVENSLLEKQITVR